MKGKIRSITAFLLVFALLIMYLPAIAIATDGVATLKDVGGNLEINATNTVVTATYANGTATITGTDLAINGNDVTTTTAQTLNIVVTGNKNYDGYLRYDGNIQAKKADGSFDFAVVLGTDYTNFNIEFEGAVNVTFSDATINNGVASWTIGGAAVTAQVATYPIAADKTINIDRNTIGNKVVNLTGYNSNTMQITIEENSNAANKLSFNPAVANGETSFNNPNGGNLPNDIIFKISQKTTNQGNNNNNNNNNNNQPQTNKTADINLTHIAGTYTHTFTDDNGVIHNDVVNYIPFGSQDGGVDISINGYMLQGGTALNYYAEDGATTVTFSFTHLWHLKLYDDIIINDGTNDHVYHVSDYLDYDNQKQWLDSYDGQMVTINIGNVPISNTYNVTVKLGRQWDSHIANFLWTGDPAQKDGEDYIGHAHLEMIGLEYTVGGTKYTYTEADFDKGAFDKDYVEYDSDQTLGYDEGSLVIPAGSKVTMRITPEYGYQVLAANLAESGLETTDAGVCEFSFTIGGGAAYFTADVVAVEDEVQATSEKVSSGNIVLADGSLDTGTAVLSVKDVELDEDKIADFEKNAGDYEIKSYLDIDLDQVFYRGTADSVWSNRIHELDDYATITLQLAEGLTADDIVIVHNINDGDEYEVIEIESYDSETNTITFRTKSFSNYAIATKTTSEGTTTSPNTEDMIMIYSGIMAIAIVGFTVTTLVGKKYFKK